MGAARRVKEPLGAASVCGVKFFVALSGDGRSFFTAQHRSSLVRSSSLSSFPSVVPPWSSSPWSSSFSPRITSCTNVRPPARARRARSARAGPHFPAFLVAPQPLADEVPPLLQPAARRARFRASGAPRPPGARRGPEMLPERVLLDLPAGVLTRAHTVTQKRARRAPRAGRPTPGEAARGACSSARTPSSARTRRPRRAPHPIASPARARAPSSRTRRSART